MVSTPDVAGIHSAASPVVLVVDDDSAVRELIASTLETEEGYWVLTAADGQEAIELSRSFRGSIDLLVTDEDMPRLRGSELCSQIRADRPEIQAIILTGGDPGAIRGTGAVEVCPKPVRWMTLRDRIVGLLRPPERGA